MAVKIKGQGRVLIKPLDHNTQSYQVTLMYFFSFSVDSTDWHTDRRADTANIIPAALEQSDNYSIVIWGDERLASKERR